MLRIFANVPLSIVSFLRFDNFYYVCAYTNDRANIGVMLLERERANHAKEGRRVHERYFLDNFQKYQFRFVPQKDSWLFQKNSGHTDTGAIPLTVAHAQ